MGRKKLNIVPDPPAAAGMEDDGELKKVSMYFPEKLHQRVRAAAALRGMNSYDAYRAAAHIWLRPEGPAESVQGVGPVSSEEQRFIRQALSLFRNRGKRNELGEVYRMIERLLATLPKS